jgi:hypothetical protein
MLLASHIVGFCIPTLKAAQFLPSRVDPAFVSVFRIAIQVGATLRTQPTAILPTQRLERQIDHHVVTKERLEVQEVTLKAAGLVLGDVAARIRVELLNVDLMLGGDRAQAAYALPVELNHRGSGDEDTLDHRLQPKVQPNR